jgi:hypothetical protein
LAIILNALPLKFSAEIKLLVILFTAEALITEAVKQKNEKMTSI